MFFKTIFASNPWNRHCVTNIAIIPDDYFPPTEISTKDNAFFEIKGVVLDIECVCLEINDACSEIQKEAVVDIKGSRNEYKEINECYNNNCN